MPTMFAATGYELVKTLLGKHAKEGSVIGRMPMNGHEWMILIIGFAVSFLVALAVVAWFMNWVRKRSFTPFAVYRILIGIVVLWCVAKGYI